MTPEWIRLTRLDNQAKHFQVSHIISIGPCEEGSLIRAFGAAPEAVRETPDEIMALLGVDARPEQPDKQPARTTIIIGRETLKSLANRQAVVVGNVTMIDGDNFPRGLFLSPAPLSEETLPAVLQTEADARLLAEIRAREAHFQRWMGPDGCANESQLDRRFLLRLLDEAAAVQQWQPIETAPEDKSVLIYIPNLSGVYRGRLLSANIDRHRHWSIAAVTRGLELDDTLQPTHWMPLPEPPK